jgi:heme-degrading monooxygenase HmoA
VKLAVNDELPYYAVIFTSRRTPRDEGYAETAKRMEELSATAPGFLGIHSARGEDGFGITVSYWKSLEDIHRWKSNLSHP